MSATTMTPKGTLFFDEWQACLRAHYIHVVRTQDSITEPTLRHVLLTTGLTEDELEALRVEALDALDAALDAAPDATDTADEIEAAPPAAVRALEAPDPPDEFPGEDADELETGAFADQPDGDLLAGPPLDALDEPSAANEPHPLDDRADDARDDADDADDAADAAPDEPYAPPPNQLSLF